MLLFLSSLVASFDGFLIGISLKCMNLKLSIQNICVLFISNFVIYSCVIFLYTFFQFQFVTQFVSTLLYLFFAFLAWKDNDSFEEHTPIQELHLFPCILLALTHSFDGALVSLNFVYEYPCLLLIFLFSFMAVLLLVLGYLFANSFHHIKKSNYFSALFFVLLAIWNQFF